MTLALHTHVFYCSSMTHSQHVCVGVAKSAVEMLYSGGATLLLFCCF